MDMESWIDRFPGMRAFAPDVRKTLTDRARVVRLKAGTVIFGPGKAPENLLLLLDGTVRVSQVSDGGREIVLYRVQAGESCVLTTACLLAYEDYRAEGVAESDIEAAAIPKSVFEQLIAQSPEFRTFVFAAYSRRITDLFLIINDIAFGRMDIRLAQKLLDLATDGRLQVTHQTLATELGTAREVVSRQLAEFQRRGRVQLSRGAVEIIDAGSLQELADAA